MGSKRLITVLLVCLFVYNEHTVANAGNLQEQRHEYQYERSSKVVGGTGYYNSRSGNIEELGTDLQGWTQSQKEAQGVAEKLKTELQTAEPSQYPSRQQCQTICRIIPGFVGKTQEEIDIIANDMTAQIIEDLRSGKLARSQMNQPNWYEQQVEQKLYELRQHHQEQHQQNVYRASSRFHDQVSQNQPTLYIGGSTYNKDTEDLQQQNIFTDDDLRQVQQNVFGQRQHQQQGNFYQQQSQNQHTVYTRPVIRYYNSQSTNLNRANEEKLRTVYPTPVVMATNVREEKNFTASSNTADIPQVNQYDHREEEIEEEYTQTQATPTVIPSYDHSYYAQKEYEERQHSGHRPRPYPTTAQTVQTSQTTVSESERTIPVVNPTQQTVTTSNVRVEQEEKEVRRQPQLPNVYNYNREEKTEETETYRRPSIVRPTQRTTTYDVRNTEKEKNVEIHTPSPVQATTNSKHSIYNHILESEVVPNYQPRVIIDKNTEFEFLNHQRDNDYRPQITPVVTQTQTREREEEERRHRFTTPQRPTQTTYTEQHHVGENEVQVQVTPRYQPGNTSQHVVTSETEETHTHVRPQHPIHTSHGQTSEYNQTSVYTIYGRYPKQPIYPSFNTNITTFENGDSYVRSESHIPTSFVIEMTVEEYDERLHNLRNALIQLGYGRLTDEEYNATIATGGFTHNGYKYLYNSNSGRYEKTSKIEVNDEEYAAIFETLQQKLIEIGFGEMCEQEVKQTITTGVFIRDGNKFVYNADREEYDRIQIQEEERKEIFARIQELLRRLGYRLLSHKENQGVLINGHFIRAAHQWIYNIVDGTVEKTIFVGDFAEFTDDEYREIYQKIQDTLRRIGYDQMSSTQCNATITSGTFERGGIYYSYNPMSGEFERILLSQDEYKDRVHNLRQELRRLGHKELSADEYRKIIYQGYFHHGGYRYEYVKDFRRYERVEMSAEEYNERLRQLKKQLLRIRYGTMSEDQCNSTIASGKFYFGGYEWVYSFDTKDYQMGNRSNIDPTANPNNTTEPKAVPVSPDNGNAQARRIGIISKNRGDQPPQHFAEDYESDEIIEEEPGMGYYPTGKKPEVGLATPETFDQIRETTPKPTNRPRYVAPTVPTDLRTERERYEKQQTVQTWPRQPENSVSERRYHRTQSSYTQTTGLLPQQLATQRAMRHVPADELEESSTEYEGQSTPYEPPFVSTEAYLVGHERPYNPNDESDIIERYLKNERHHSGSVVSDSVRVHENQQQDVQKQSENLEDLGQRYEDFDGQHEEDVQQQVIDLNEEAEDLRQQQVDVNDDGAYQQKLLDNYSSRDRQREYNSHYRQGEKETAQEYEAEVVEVTEKAAQNEESPGVWSRFKNKVKDIFD